MTDVKISALTADSAVSGTDEFEKNEAGTSKKTTASKIGDYVLANKIVGGTGHGDSIYTVVAGDRFVYTNAAFTASRTWTLPAANAVNAGQSILVADLQGTVTATNTLVIARAGSDTINGGTSVTIDVAYGAMRLYSDGSSKWFALYEAPYGTSANQGVQLTSAAKLPAVDGSLLTNLPTAFAFSATSTSFNTGTTTLSLTGLNCEMALLIFDAVTAESATSFSYAVSTDNGSNYSAAKQLGASGSLSTTACYFMLLLIGLKVGRPIGLFTPIQTTSFNTDAITSSTVTNALTAVNKGSQINAIQFSGASNFTGGNVRILTV